MTDANPYYIITGAPSTGKSSVIEAIQDHGFTCHFEIAREVIRENQENDINIFPWLDMREYSDLVYDRMKVLYSSLNGELAFFDRSVVDLIGYLEFSGDSAPDFYRDLALNTDFNKKVFVMPVWEEIYTNDKERKETLEEARKIDAALRNAYSSIGFELVEVPVGTVEERTSFILNHIGVVPQKSV